MLNVAILIPDSMIATNIAGRDKPGRAVDMRQVNFRMPHDLHERLETHLYTTGKRTFQGFALEAITQKLNAELRALKKSHRNE